MNMYTPPSFREDRTVIMHDLIGMHPLGLLVTVGASGIQASPVPFLLYPDEGSRGVLRAHMARANPHWKEIQTSAECLVVFQGRNGYVTPSWYATKATTHQVVPTWNYVTVQVRGRPIIVEDSGWLRKQINDLTESQEKSRPQPWSISDAPVDFVTAQMTAIIGIEIPIGYIEGKWKLSQNKDEADRMGVIRGLRSENDPHRNTQLADLIDTSQDEGQH